MTYFPEIAIKGADSPSNDAFARFRTSNPLTLYDAKFINDSGSILWDTSGSGGGFGLYSQSCSTVYLKTPAVANSSVIRQSKEWFNYQPGKSQLISMTGVMAPQPGVIKRMGYFSANNGLFFETSGSSVYVVKRSNTTGVVVDTKVSQSAWNIDTMDGNGISGIDMNYNKAHIYIIDFEWLGVGRVRFGHYYDGIPYYTHYFGHGNELNNVYMRTPNLPLRYEIINKAGTTAVSMSQICASVVSEGGLDPNGINRTVDTAGTSRNVSQNITGSLVAIRLKSGYEGATVVVEHAEVFTPTANTTYYWKITLNPSGSNSFVWEDIPNSALQKATNVSSVRIKVTNSFPLAVRIHSGYASSTTQAKGTVTTSVDNLLRLGTKINGNRDVLVLAVCPLTNAADFYGSLTFREVR